jgi:hypothetical protein
MLTRTRGEAAEPKPDRWPLGPFAAIIGGLALAVLLSFGYTSWAINSHSRQACAELQILAAAPGAITSYDRTVKKEYEGLYALRCS